MKNVSQVLESKGNEFWSVDPDATVYEALQLMAEKNIGAVPVLLGGRLAGMFSERDYARKVVLHGKSSKNTAVREIMSERVVTISPDQSVEVCMELMTNQHIRHLPVVNSGEIVGMISIGDVVKSIISEQEFLISQLENYITGSPG